MAGIGSPYECLIPINKDGISSIPGNTCPSILRFFSGWRLHETIWKFGTDVSNNYCTNAVFALVGQKQKTADQIWTPGRKLHTLNGGTIYE